MREMLCVCWTVGWKTGRCRAAEQSLLNCMLVHSNGEDNRPMMGQVVHMLENVMDVEIPHIPRSLENSVGMEDCSYSAKPDNLF